MVCGSVLYFFITNALIHFIFLMLINKTDITGDTLHSNHQFYFPLIDIYTHETEFWKSLQT